MELLDILIFSLAAVLLCLWWRYSPFPVSAVVARRPQQRLPPGPPGWPLVGNLLQVILQNRPFIYVIRDLRAKYGPIFTMKMGQRTLVIVTSSQLIHEALVQRGPLFATRPPDSPTRLVFSVGKCAINSAEYGPLWRTLRRNFVTELINPARIRQCAWIRKWTIKDHFMRLEREALEKGYVEVMSNCRLTICSILICLCFGAKISERKIKHIEGVLKEVMMMTTPKLPDFLPVLTPLFRRQLKAARDLRKRQMDCLVPLIRERKAFVERGGKVDDNGGLRNESCFEMLSPLGAAYVDSLLGLEPAGRELGDEELVTLCSEVISAGTETFLFTYESYDIFA